MELDPRRRFTDTKTKENKRKRKQTKKQNKTKQNTSMKYMISLGNFSCMQLV